MQEDDAAVFILPMLESEKLQERNDGRSRIDGQLPAVVETFRTSLHAVVIGRLASR